jgi:ElaB/YqjD/DUF883 family membrane-anchored ribosome-binding protein
MDKQSLQTPTKKGELSKSKLRNDISFILHDSPSRNTRSRTKSLQFRNEEFDYEITDFEREQERALVLKKRKADFHYIDWLQDLPFLNRIVELISMVISFIYVLFWSAWQLLCMLPKVKISSRVSSQMKRATLMIFLMTAGLYLLRSKREVFEKRNVSLASTPNGTDAPSPQTGHVQRFEEMMMIVQNQITPLIQKLKSQQEILDELRTSLVTATDSRNSELDSLFNEKLNALKVEFESILMEMQERLQSSTTQNRDQIQSTVERASKDLINEEFLGILHSLLPNEKDLKGMDKNVILAKLRKHVGNHFSMESTGQASVYEKYGPDYSLFSAGANIDLSMTSESFSKRGNSLSQILKLPLGPAAVLDPDLTPGNCWAFKGLCLLN